LTDEIKSIEYKNIYDELFINILRSFSRLGSIYSAGLKPFGVTLQQYLIMRLLKRHHPEPVSIILLKECMPEKQSDVSRLIERMVGSGLVERNTCPLDRRKVDIVILEKGLKLLSEIESAEHNWISRMQNLPETQAKKLNELLDELNKDENF
jgi:DNA-binding MarR family transcriptional regulator